MAPQMLHLPDGQSFTVTPVFGGVGFRSHELNRRRHPYPVGWTTVLQSDGRPFAGPTLQTDSLFISSVSMPADADFKPAASPTRQTAMMLWVTLYWYFHQPAPSPRLATPACRDTPEPARPAADWRIAVRRDGVLRGRSLMSKLEHMGLVAADDPAAAADLAVAFVSRRMFWQTPGRLFLFTLQPVPAPASAPASPAASPPLSPTAGLSPYPRAPDGPFFSTSHLPTYYPPAPPQYVFTDGVRHPLRPRPPRTGDVFYSRFVPSAGQYLSFRVASSAPTPVPYLGPVGPHPPEHSRLAAMSDLALLQTWHANPRVSQFWGPFQPDCLDKALRRKHSFPVVGLWDGVPFGYFEIYWAKEDALGRLVGSEVGDWDRGLHVMVGEEWSRGRVPPWLHGLVHWCLTADLRTMNICLEPRVDNTRILRHLSALGFARERHVSFPHKQAWYVRLPRESWHGPAL